MKNKLSILETERAIKFVKDNFEVALANNLNLLRVSAPLFVPSNSGLNDNLNGIERPVEFDVLETKENVQIVQSLAKWKRLALKKYGFAAGQGLYTDMNAIRRDEKMDNLHSIYVDQWDWEMVIDLEQRNIDKLKDTVRKIVGAICDTKLLVNKEFGLDMQISRDVYFVSTYELEELYPDLSPKERENKITKEKKTVFIMQIGDKLKNSEKHDGRAPDYDDWKLNGDILVWYEPLNCAVELSSMGIRVDAETLKEQLEKSGKEHYKNYEFHKMLLNNELPLTMGGGIGQSRLCLVMLEKVHIGQVCASVWSDEIVRECKEKGIELL